MDELNISINKENKCLSNSGVYLLFYKPYNLKFIFINFNVNYFTLVNCIP